MLFWMPAGIFLLDRIAKILAQRFLAGLPGGFTLWQGVMRLHYVENTGMAFGLLSGQRWLLIALSLIAVTVIALSLRPYELGLWAKLSLMAVLGGMAGNFLDRVALGHVVDMIELLFVRFAIFNVADVFISAGAVFLCLSLLFRPGDWKKKGEEAR